MTRVPELRLSTPLSELPGVGKRRAERLAHIGLHNVSDLLRHLPMRYERHAAESAIDQLQQDTIGTARGTVVAARLIPSRGRGRSRFEATLEDDEGTLSLTWFNGGYLSRRIKAGQHLRVEGKVGQFNGYPQMVNPRWEVIDADDDEPVAQRDARLMPIYPATEDLPSRAIEQLVAATLPRVIDQVADPLPPDLTSRHNMLPLDQAFRLAHEPEHEDDAGAARRRLAYNELLLMQIGIAVKRHYNRHRLIAPALNITDAVDAHIRERFGFELTDSQQKVIGEIAADLRRTQPMNRLLQGDVGAGKTVVALYALLAAVADRKQGALMAPTELLAEQHYISITNMLEGSGVRIALLTAGRPTAERKQVEADIAAGEVDIVIGTQALLTESVQFADLAVVVVDEQHRFGVLQRQAFRQRAAGSDKTRSPHYLVMTATPIPRTLSLTIFGDLDVSTIDGLPPGRTPITTRVVGEEKADDVYGYMAKQIAEGRQAYVVVPTIDEGPAALKNVNAHAKLLQDKYCKGQKVATIHGRLKPQTRQHIMERFRDGRIDVLVATTVIEVGVDVPNATMMVVEHAERFGLAQLHQLRGRIGRGSAGHRSVCAFIAEPTTDDGQQRMDAIAKTSSGFKIAEYDLEIRGMGDFFGTRQHGLPPLRVARIPDDMDLLQLAKRDAEQIIEADPQLKGDQWQRLRKVLLQQYGDTLGLIDVG